MKNPHHLNMSIAVRRHLLCASFFFQSGEETKTGGAHEARDNGDVRE